MCRTLPDGFTLEEYFDKALEFLLKYSWLFEFPNTKILSNNVLQNIPKEWVESFSEINDFWTADLQLEACPSDLIIFLESCKTYSIKGEAWEEFASPRGDQQLPLSLKKGLSPKKLHEVERLVSVVIHESTAVEASAVVDVGSGLGYLERWLISIDPNLKILGLEMNFDFVKEASRLSDNLNENNAIYYEVFTITKQGVPFLQRLIRKHFNEDISILIGLHTCGDLMVNCIELFMNSVEIRSMIVVPCCHHKMAQFSEENLFCNFPLSQLLKNQFSLKNLDCNKFGVPFLRLASQDTVGRWKQQTVSERHQRAFRTLARGVLDVLLSSGGLTMLKKSRRFTRKSQPENWSNFTKDLFYSVEFLQNDLKRSNSEVHSELNILWNEYKNEMAKVELFNFLQANIQIICESLILFDRQAYLIELGLKNVHIVKLFDDIISPRCHSFIVRK